MHKNYQSIAAFLGFESVASDKENGLYLQEELADKIEARLQEVANIEATLQAKEQEIADLNAKLANIEAEQATAISNAVAEKEAQLAEKEQELTAKAEECSTLGNRISELEASAAEHETAITEKDATIATLNAKVSELTTSIEAKDAEIAALSEAAPEPQTPAVNEGTTSSEEKSSWDDMSLAEKAEDWANPRCH